MTPDDDQWRHPPQTPRERRRRHLAPREVCHVRSRDSKRLLDRADITGRHPTIPS